LKYFRDSNNINIAKISKIKIPKIDELNEISLKKNNFMRNDLVKNSLDKTSRTDDYNTNINYSFERPKFNKNKIQLTSLEDKKVPPKPASRPPVFERLTSGLIKGSKRKAKQDHQENDLEETKEILKPRRMKFMANVGDTGSSFDKIIEKGYYESNPYDPDYSTYSIKPKLKSKNRSLQHKSFVMNNSKMSFESNSLREYQDRRDVVERYDIL